MREFMILFVRGGAAASSTRWWRDDIIYTQSENINSIRTMLFGAHKNYVLTSLTWKLLLIYIFLKSSA